MRAGFSTIIVHAILFIAATIAVYLFVSSLYQSLYDVQGAMIQKEKFTSERMRTIIDIDSCAYNTTTYNLTLYVTNRGFTSLSLNNTLLFLDGIYQNNTTIKLVNEISPNGVWDRFETIEIIKNTSTLLTGYHTVKVVVSTGAYDSKTISIVGNNCTVV